MTATAPADCIFCRVVRGDFGTEFVAAHHGSLSKERRLDAELRATLRGFVERGHTMIIVTHSINFLEGLADHILYMESGEAVEYNEAEQLMRDPRDPRTREFLSHAR